MGATAAVAGQNLGAGHPERSARAAQVAAGIGLGVAAIVGFAFIVTPRALLGIFALTEGVGFDLGRELLFYLAFSGFFVTVALTYTGGLQGTGDTKSPLYISIVSQVVIPIGLCTYFSVTRGLEPADIWLAIVLGHMTRATLSVLRFRQGKWRDIVVDIDPRPRVGSRATGSATHQRFDHIAAGAHRHGHASGRQALHPCRSGARMDGPVDAGRGATARAVGAV